MTSLLKPKLRFAQFFGNWMNYKFNELFIVVATKNTKMKSNKVLTNSAQKGIVLQNDYFDREIANQKNLTGYYLVAKGDFVYNPRISVSAPVGPINRNNLIEGVVSPLYNVFRLLSGSEVFFEYYFQGSKWHKYLSEVANFGARHDRMNIGIGDFNKMPFKVPSIEEQTKIAQFFSLIDEKLQALNKKKELLERYKKGVMQQIFSQKIRFKDEKGEDFPDWEEKVLGDIGKTFNGLTNKTSEHFGKGSKFIKYKQVFDFSSIKLSECDLVEISSDEHQNTVEFGDVFFTVSSETPKDIGMASVLLDDAEDVYLNSFCFGYRLNSLNTLSPHFSKYLFRSPKFRKNVVKLAQGSTRYNMSKVEAMKIKVILPTINEQLKISTFLYQIDDKITQTTTQIELAETWKKGLLQKMFV